MKQTFTLALLFVAVMSNAQKTDTLYIKDFNDGKLEDDHIVYSLSTNNREVLSAEKIGNGINGTSALVLNPANQYLSKMLLDPKTPLSDQLLTLTVNATGVDTAYVAYQLQKKEGLFPKNDQIGFSGSSKTSVTIQYYNTEGSAIKLYDAVIDYTLNVKAKEAVSGKINTINNTNATVISSYDKENLSGGSVVFSLGYTILSENITLVSTTKTLVGLPSEIKTILKNDFCPTTINESDCQKRALVILTNVNASKSLEESEFLIDDLVVIGKKKGVTTGFEEQALTQSAKKVMVAYTFQGVEIADWTNYSGPAIVLYTDGSRAKLVR